MGAVARALERLLEEGRDFVIGVVESGAKHIAAIKRHWAKIAPWLGLAGSAAGPVV